MSEALYPETGELPLEIDYGPIEARIMAHHVGWAEERARKARETLRMMRYSDKDKVVITTDISPDWEIRIERDISNDRLDQMGRTAYSITGEITVYYTDPLLYAAVVDGQKLLDEWIEDMLQERVDEEGCGATISAMREWGDD